MKIRNTLTALFAGAVLLGAQALQAHGKEEQSSTADSMQVNSVEALKTMRTLLDTVNRDIAAGKLDRLHGFAEAINEALENMDKDPALDAAKKKRVTGYVKNIAKLTDKMHDAADEKKLDETKKAAKKLNAQAALLEKQFSKTGKAKAKESMKMDSSSMKMKM